MQASYFHSASRLSTAYAAASVDPGFWAVMRFRSMTTCDTQAASPSSKIAPRFFSAASRDQGRPIFPDAVNQALRALGRLLLAGSEEELAEIRERILGVVGPSAGLLAATVPEFAALLGVPTIRGIR